jgi:aspartate dehydrogenase
MVTCALATVGLDRCRGRLIADPALDHAIAEVEATGSDGSYLATTKRQPMVGVSGTEMFASTLRSVLKATGRGPTMDFL